MENPKKSDEKEWERKTQTLHTDFELSEEMVEYPIHPSIEFENKKPLEMAIRSD